MQGEILYPDQSAGVIMSTQSLVLQRVSREQVTVVSHADKPALLTRRDFLNLRA